MSCEPYKVRGGRGIPTREVIAGLLGTAQKFQVLDLKMEASSRNHKLSGVTGRGGKGERAKTGIIQVLAQPAPAPTSSAAAPFIPRPVQKNGSLENRRA